MINEILKEYSWSFGAIGIVIPFIIHYANIKHRQREKSKQMLDDLDDVYDFTHEPNTIFKGDMGVYKNVKNDYIKNKLKNIIQQFDCDGINEYIFKELEVEYLVSGSENGNYISCIFWINVYKNIIPDKSIRYNTLKKLYYMSLKQIKSNDCVSMYDAVLRRGSIFKDKFVYLYKLYYKYNLTKIEKVKEWYCIFVNFKKRDEYYLNKLKAHDYLYKGVFPPSQQYMCEIYTPLRHSPQLRKLPKKRP